MHRFQPYTQDFKSEFLKNLDSHLTQQKGPHFAAFDADGTLWSVDAGEAFFQFQIDSGEIKGLPKDPWGHYHSWKAKDPIPAYYWLAQINHGLPINQVREMASKCCASYPDWPVFLDQKWIIDELKMRSVRVFVVTASVKWAVEPFAEKLGLKKEDVLGIETEVINGIVSSTPLGEPTFKKGKADRLLRETNGVRPIFCSGNTMGDYELLKSSSFLSLAVTSAKIGDETYGTEQALQQKAKEHGWLIHQF